MEGTRSDRRRWFRPDPTNRVGFAVGVFSLFGMLLATRSVRGTDRVGPATAVLTIGGMLAVVLWYYGII